MMPTTIHNAVIEGLQKLVVLRLRNTPAQEAITAVAAVWIEVLSKHQRWQEADLARVNAAFASLMATATDWPAPRHFLDHLPPKPKPQSIAPPPPSPEQRAQIEQMLKDLTQRYTRNTP